MATNLILEAAKSFLASKLIDDQSPRHEMYDQYIRACAEFAEWYAVEGSLGEGTSGLTSDVITLRDYFAVNCPKSFYEGIKVGRDSLKEECIKRYKFADLMLKIRKLELEDNG